MKSKKSQPADSISYLNKLQVILKSYNFLPLQSCDCYIRVFQFLTPDSGNPKFSYATGIVTYKIQELTIVDNEDFTNKNYMTTVLTIP